MRGTTMVRDIEESGLKAQIRADMIKKLSVEWNDIQHTLERAELRREAYQDIEDDVRAERLDEELAEAEMKIPASASKEERREILREAEEAYWESVRQEERRMMEPFEAKLEVIEELLEELGARMMRPYEHWNEDERYMEYMESRYDDYDY